MNLWEEEKARQGTESVIVTEKEIGERRKRESERAREEEGRLR